MALCLALKYVDETKDRARKMGEFRDLGQTCHHWHLDCDRDQRKRTSIAMQVTKGGGQEDHQG